MTSATAEKRAAGALGARRARACDSCMRRRARWYCAADDAFLCQSCDASVHSANPLASRHERVRLKNTSSSSTLSPLKPLRGGKGEALPAWINGFRRKARTPRHHKPGSTVYKSGPAILVPDLASSEDHSADDSDDQLLYRVPIFDPVVANFCSSSSAAFAPPPSGADDESKPVPAGPSSTMAQAADSMSGFLPTDAELADFAADVESLLGNGLYDESAFCMEGLGLLEESRHGDNIVCFFNSGGGGRVKVEEDDAEDGARGRASTSQVMDAELDLSRDTLELTFDYDSPTTGGEEEDAAEEEKASVGIIGSCCTEEKKRMALRLDYKAVIAAWDCQSSPWTTGDRPQFNPNDPWPECIVGCASEFHLYGGEIGSSLGVQAAGGDGGREARVSRYREKRRTRLFSKKIRYEVRKLNAEKRPRMKGRFVKRASFAAQAFAY